jgi:hypothetical protein
MVCIVEHLSIEDLERRYRAAEDATEVRHTQTIWLLAQGRSVLDVAGVLAFAPRWVEQLAARYNAHGPEALGDQRRRNGRAASVLTPALLAALAERLRAPPDDGGRWTGAKSLPADLIRGWRSGWPPSSAWSGCTSSAAGRRSSACAGPSRRPARATRAQQHPSNRPSSRGARQGGGTCQGGAPRAASRGLGD